MDRYRRLASNTFIFAIGTLSSKVLVFLLLPFYTRVMSEAEYGIVDAVVQAGNLLIPIATVGITHAIIRFGLEKLNDRRAVYTTGVFTVICGFLILLLFAPLLSKVLAIVGVNGYVPYIYAFILMSSLQGICAQFVRARGMVRLYAVDGVFRTALTIGLNILFLAGMQLGIVGYLLATIVTDLISTLSLFLLAKLYKFISIRSVKASLTKAMLKYSLPMIPNTICTWIINISDRYLVLALIDAAANGIYAIANKIPTILIIVSNIFGDAWQMSAFTEENRKERERFFSKVANVYRSVAFVSASFLILTAKLSTTILTSPAFYTAWTVMPLLIMGTTFACLSSYLASVYMVQKKTIPTLITTAIAAGTNIVLNIFLIPKYGIAGAAFATFTSYLVMFLVRLIHTQFFIRIRWNYLKLALSFVVISLQTWIMMAEVPGWIVIESLMFLFVLVLNMKELMQTVRKLFGW